MFSESIQKKKKTSEVPLHKEEKPSFSWLRFYGSRVPELVMEPGTQVPGLVIENFKFLAKIM